MHTTLHMTDNCRNGEGRVKVAARDCLFGFEQTRWTSGRWMRAVALWLHTFGEKPTELGCSRSNDRMDVVRSRLPCDIRDEIEGWRGVPRYQRCISQFRELGQGGVRYTDPSLRLVPHIADEPSGYRWARKLRRSSG